MVRDSSLHNLSDTSKLDDSFFFDGGERDRTMFLLIQSSRGLCFAREIAETETMTTKKTMVLMEVFIILFLVYLAMIVACMIVAMHDYLYIADVVLQIIMLVLPLFKMLFSRRLSPLFQ